MKWIGPTMTGLALTAVAMAARRTWRRRNGPTRWPVGRPAREPRQRWHSVTVNRPLDQVAPDGQLPQPLARLAETAEVQIRPAPADRGTELAVRPHNAPAPGLRGMAARARGRDPRYAVRAALRETKQLVETGELLSPDRPPTKRTVANRPVQFATRRAREEGRL